VKDSFFPFPGIQVHENSPEGTAHHIECLVFLLVVMLSAPGPFPDLKIGQMAHFVVILFGQILPSPPPSAVPPRYLLDFGEVSHRQSFHHRHYTVNETGNQGKVGAASRI
jgi:hypothetical protein